MKGCAAHCGELGRTGARTDGGVPLRLVVIGALAAATGFVPGADAIARLGSPIPATRLQPTAQPDWSAPPGQNAQAAASAVAPANPAALPGPATDAIAHPQSARLIRATEALQASGFGSSAAAGRPVRWVVATAALEAHGRGSFTPSRRVIAPVALEAHGRGSFMPSRRVIAPVALEAYGLGSRTDRTVQRAVLPLR